MISVCIATYNGEKYIAEQLDSILCQLTENDEIVISDDSSFDQTINIIRSYNDKRIRLFEGQKFRNPVFNFEFALKQSKGEYIFLSDQDDIWLPGKVEITLEYLSKYDLIVSDCKIADKNLEILHESCFKIMNSGNGFVKNFIKSTYFGNCMAFKREVLLYVLPFPRGIVSHDLWIGLCVEIKGSPLFLNKPLILWRRHGENASTGSEKSKNSLIYKIKYRLHLIKVLIKLQLTR